MVKILIADDRQLMRSALKTIFAMRPKWEVCGEATDGHEVVTKVSELQPDLILMDFKMPLTNGIQAATQISATSPSIPIVMLLTHFIEMMNWMQRPSRPACGLLSRNRTAFRIC
jgi:DNA-binding NarL/FixJ family response regulator